MKLLRRRISTLGDRDFSSAVSGFCQVFASAYGRGCVRLRPTPKIPAARKKNLWYPGYRISVYDRIPERLYVIRMEFLSLSRRRSSSRNVPSDEEREETAVLAGYILYLSARFKLVISEPLQGETCHPATVIWRTLGRYGTNTGHGSKIYLDVFSVCILHRHPTGISI